MTEKELPSTANRFFTPVLFLICVGLTVAAYFYHTDPVQFVLYSPESLVYFEGTSRVQQGDLPNHDFATPLGPALWVIPSIFLSQSQMWLVIPVLLITATALTTLTAAAALRSENIIQFFVLLALVVFCAAAVNAPTRFGDAQGVLHWDSIHLNIANTVLIVLTAWVTYRLTSQADALTWLAAGLLGLSLFLLLMLHAVSFLAALIILACVLRSFTQDVMRILGAFIAPLLFSTVLFPAAIIGYISDIAVSLSEYSSDPTEILYEIQSFGTEYALQFAALCALVFLSYRANPTQTRAIFLVFPALVLATLFLHFFETTPTRSTLLMGMIVGLAYTSLARPTWPLACLPVLFLMAAFATDTYTKAIALEQNRRLAETVDTVTYNRFRIDTQVRLVSYVRTAEAAFAHLDINVSPECLARGYMVMDRSNPFTALLSRPGTSMETLLLDKTAIAAPATAQPFQKFTGDAAIIMVPKAPLWDSAKRLATTTYAEDLTDFSVVFENEGWVAYKHQECD